MTSRPVVLPKHVRACQHSPERLERWGVWTWNRERPHEQKRVPYSCNSWRCETCRRPVAQKMFARLKQACTAIDPETGEPLDPRAFVFLVLTLDRNGHRSGRPWRDVNEAWSELGKMTTALTKRIGATWGWETRLKGSKRPRWVRSVGNRWVAVPEAHRSGWPHMNLILWCPELAEHLEEDRDARLADPELADAVAEAQALWRSKLPIGPELRERARRAVTVRGALREMITAAGWGYQSTAERARNLEAVLGYGIKMAGLHEASLGELAKTTQLPMNAPERFRRLRSGRKFIPQAYKDPDITGCLLRRRMEAGQWKIQQVNPPKDEAAIIALRLACKAELALIREEAERARRKLPAWPPLRSAKGGKLDQHDGSFDGSSERRAAIASRELAACG